MSDETLSDLLERAADGHPVGAPPLDQMLARDRRARKRRAGIMALAASAVVGSVITGTTLLFGHGDSREPGPIDTPSSKRIVLDGEWRVVALTDDDGKSLLRSDKVRVIFKAGKVGGSTECNGFGGTYRQSGLDGQNLFIPNRSIGSTLVGCNETAIGLRLPAVRHVSKSGGVLFLEDVNRTNIATLVRVGEGVVLSGSWRFAALNDADGRSVLTARLAEKGRVTFSHGEMSGTTECNLVSSKYAQSGIDGRDVTFSPLYGTQVGCNDQPIAAGLDAVRHVSEENGNLYLQDENWATIATLERIGSSTPTDKPYGNPSIGTVPGENEDQAGQIRAAKIIERDPSYGGVVLGKRLITAYLTSGYDEATIERARAALNPGDRLQIKIVEHTWRELNQINNRFNNLFSKFERAGARLGVSGIDVRRNEVYVKTPDVAKVRRVLAENGLTSVVVRYAKYEVANTL